jgi:hypothetical protein
LLTLDDETVSTASSNTCTSPRTHLFKKNDSSVDCHALLGDLIDLGIFDVRRFGESPEERRSYLINHSCAARTYFIESLAENIDNPLLQHLMKKTSLNKDEIEKLIAEMPIDDEQIRRINLSDVNVVNQSPFHARSFFSELENKDQFLEDMAWMNSNVLVMQKRFAEELEELDARNTARLRKLHETQVPRYDTVCIGRGNNMTKYWEHMQDKKNQSIIFIGKDGGIWDGHSQLAQMSSILEYEAETAASNYNPRLQEAFGVSHLDARHFYQSLVHSQYIHDFPAVAGEVLKIRNSPVSGYEIQVAYNLEDSRHPKAVHANKLIVGTGLSDSRNALYQKGQFYKNDFESIVGNKAALLYRALADAGYFQHSGKTLNKIPQPADIKKIYKEECTDDQIESIIDVIKQINNGRTLTPLLSKADYERLSTFDPDKGFTPIVDGNAFILSDAECSARGKGRTILAYGGGGTAAACVRRGLFLKDRPSIRLNPESYGKRVNEVIWIAERGLSALREGTLAVDARTTLEEVGRLWNCCEITSIEPLEAGDKLRISIDRYHVVDDISGHEKVVLRRIDGKLHRCVAERKVIEVDQLVNCIGQDNRNIEQIFDGINISAGTAEITKEPNLHVPLYGSIKGHQNIQFHGAASAAGVLNRKYMQAIEPVIKSENTPLDAVPGSMPLSWSSIRASHFSSSGIYYESVNATMDFKAVIDRHLHHWGVSDKDVREAFLKEVVQHRSETGSGITCRKLDELIGRHGLRGVLTIDGVNMLRPIKGPALLDGEAGEQPELRPGPGSLAVGKAAGEELRAVLGARG